MILLLIANATIWTVGPDLSATCGGPAGYQPSMECRRYVTGAAEGISAMGQVVRAPTLCIPTSVTDIQMALVTRKYINDHPEKLNLNGVDIVWNALYEAFPCPKPARKKIR